MAPLAFPPPSSGERVVQLEELGTLPRTPQQSLHRVSGPRWGEVVLATL